MCPTRLYVCLPVRLSRRRGGGINCEDHEGANKPPTRDSPRERNRDYGERCVSVREKCCRSRARSRKRAGAIVANCLIDARHAPVFNPRRNVDTRYRLINYREVITEKERRISACVYSYVCVCVRACKGPKSTRDLSTVWDRRRRSFSLFFSIFRFFLLFLGYSNRGDSYTFLPGITSGRSLILLNERFFTGRAISTPWLAGGAGYRETRNASFLFLEPLFC